MKTYLLNTLRNLNDFFVIVVMLGLAVWIIMLFLHVCGDEKKYWHDRNVRWLKRVSIVLLIASAWLIFVPDKDDLLEMNKPNTHEIQHQTEPAEFEKRGDNAD